MDCRSILSPCQIGFWPHCSVRNVYADLESLILLARRQQMHATLVTLDIAKAYDSVEHSILLQWLLSLQFPVYLVAWVTSAFLQNAEFFCAQNGVHSVRYKQTGDVPQV